MRKTLAVVSALAVVSLPAAAMAAPPTCGASVKTPTLTKCVRIIANELPVFNKPGTVTGAHCKYPNNTKIWTEPGFGTASSPSPNDQRFYRVRIRNTPGSFYVSEWVGNYDWAAVPCQ